MLLIVAVIAAFELTVSPLWQAYLNRQEAADALRARGAHYAQISATRPHNEALRERLQRQQENEPLDFTETNPSLAAAALQARVKAIVSEAGGKLLRMQMLPAQQEGEYRRIAARVRLQAPTEALGPMLYGLESSVPYLFVEELTIVGRGGRAIEGARPRPPQPLDVRLEVLGYHRPGETSEGTGG